MAVDDGDDVGPRAVDLAMNEALEIDAPVAGVDRLAVEIERQDVRRRDERGRHVAREQEVRGRAVVPDADVTEAVDDAFVVEDPIGDRELGDECGVGRRERRCGPRGHSAMCTFFCCV